MADLASTTDEVLTASRALLGIVARSVAPVLDRVTVPQFRVMVILSSHEGPVRSSDLAEALGVHPSTLTRNADRMVGDGWIRRRENPQNRREILIELTDKGASLVGQVTRRRRTAITEILAPLAPEDRELIVAGMAAFARAAGEPAARDLLALGL
jgi:DNA-binding MarR family transcriptional regulator